MVKEITKPKTIDSAGNVVTDFYSFKTMNYQNLIAISVSAIQELENEVSMLKEEVFRLKSSQVKEQSVSKVGFVLEQNSPNPFSETTIIRYELPEGEWSAKIVITDLNGNLIKSFLVGDNKGLIEVNKGTMKPALYLYSLIVNSEVVLSKKMLVE
jgi:hypothetical protein